MTRISETDDATQPSRLVLEGLFGPKQDFSALAWQPFREGVEILRLHGEGSGPSAALLRYQAGASIPAHAHPGYEHILVLAGSQRDERGLYTAGSCVIHGHGMQHTVTSDEGCVAVAIWQAQVVFKQAEDAAIGGEMLVL